MQRSPQNKKPCDGFSLLEILIVAAIVGILAAVVLLGLNASRETAKTAKAEVDQREMTGAIELYFTDVGFYPPDVNRGWDPGFIRALPWNPDAEAGEIIPPEYASPNTNCSHCPPNWESIVQARWNGPYLSSWPRTTPWNGKYDYNYWANGITRYGCVVAAGIYVGVQGNYLNNNNIPASAEQKMIDKGFDNDHCLNGESQMLLWPLNH